MLELCRPLSADHCRHRPSARKEKHIRDFGAYCPGQGRLVSLGCPKNLVDSEVMMGMLAQAGAELTPDAEDATSSW